MVEKANKQKSVTTRRFLFLEGTVGINKSQGWEPALMEKSFNCPSRRRSRQAREQRQGAFYEKAGDSPLVSSDWITTSRWSPRGVETLWDTLMNMCGLLLDGTTTMSMVFTRLTRAHAANLERAGLLYDLVLYTGPSC